MIDLDTPRYTFAESTMIAQQQPMTGRSWFIKKWLYSPDDPIKAGSQGKTSFVTGRTVLAHAIAAEAADLGAKPQMACSAARLFTDVADPLEAPGYMRDPGELFDGAFTYLAIYPDGDAKVLRVAKGQLEDVLVARGQRKCLLLVLDFIVKRVEIELRKIDKLRAG